MISVQIKTLASSIQEENINIGQEKLILPVSSFLKSTLKLFTFLIISSTNKNISKNFASHKGNRGLYILILRAVLRLQVLGCFCQQLAQHKVLGSNGQIFIHWTAYCSPNQDNTIYCQRQVSSQHFPTLYSAIPHLVSPSPSLASALKGPLLRSISQPPPFPVQHSCHPA